MATAARAPYHGIVLAGGASRRMGQDKAFLEVDGVPLIQRALDALAGATHRTVIGGDAHRISSLGVDHLPDATPGAGPVPAIATALDASVAPLTVILPCDLPFITSDAIERLCSVLGDGDVAVPLVAGRVAGLPAVWNASLAPQVATMHERGIRSVRRIAAELSVVHFVDFRPSAWADADRPADLPLGVVTELR